MFRYIASICIFICLSSNAIGQTISGIVIDEQQQPIEFANVVLFSLPDSTMITGSITNEKGEFTLNCENEKNAFLKILFIGYETQITPVMPQQTIILKSYAIQFGEVIVKGYLPRIKLKNDGLVTLIQNTILSKAGTGNDVLKRLPLLTGDKGVFSVFGKGEALIYINNREIRDVSELENLNSEDIKDVEVISNPGAKYDASVKAVIRINTLRKIGDGFSFDIRSSYYQSQNTDLREQLNINYRKNKLDIFSTFAYSHDEWLQNSELKQKTYVDTLWTQDNKLYLNGYDDTFLGVAGMNYEISPEHYIGAKYSLSVFPHNEWTSTTNSIVCANGIFYDRWNSNEEKKATNKPTHRINAYYNGTLEKLRIDFNTDIYTSKQSSKSIIIETSQEHDSRIVTSKNDVNSQLIASKLILSYPILEGEFSLGSEYSNTHRKDIYQNEENFVSSSNIFIQEESKSFFTEYSRTILIGQFNAGVRYENLNSNYHSKNKKNDLLSRNYEQWFPNFSFTTKLKKVDLQLDYTAKTKRPSYKQMSNNVFYMNRLSMQSGNPFLKPSTIHDITLVGTYRFMQMMVSYKKINNAIIYWTEQMEENPKISILSYRNLDSHPNLTAFLSISPTIRIWSPQVSLGFVKQWIMITSNNNSISLNKPMPFASFNNSLSFPKGFLLTIDARFEGRGDYQNIYLSENQYVINIGITKSFFNEQLRIELKGHDLIRGKKDGNMLYNEQMNLFQLNYYDSREIELTVRFKFNSARSKYKGTNAGDSEINRLKINN
jgi:hypothetical protein